MLEYNIEQSSESDDLQHTVDYVSINAIVKEEMLVASKLLEHVVARILEKIIQKHPKISL